jgi:uncharacterized protein (DUF305 family)
MRELILALGIALIAVALPQAQSAGQKPNQPTATGDHSVMMMDAEFAHLAAKHHRGGIEISKVEESGGASANVKALAAKIRQGQQRDLPTLTQHGAKAAKNAIVASHEKDMDKEHQSTMAKLKSAKGAALHQAFIAEMIKHHEQMQEMIKQAHLTDQKLKQMVDKMSQEQQQELQELRKLQSSS